MLERDDAEHSVPQQWRSTFREIVDAFVEGDFQLHRHSIEGVAPIDSATAKSIADNILAYGDGLTALQDPTWNQSIYRWMNGHWQILVDLSTLDESVSDLTLFAKLEEADGSNLEIVAVYVP